MPAENSASLRSSPAPATITNDAAEDARWYAGAGTVHGAMDDHDHDAPFATQFADGSARTYDRLDAGRTGRYRLAQRRADMLARGETPPTRKRKGPRKPRPDPLDLDRLIQTLKAERHLAALRWKGGDGPLEVLPADAEDGFLVGGPVNGTDRPTLRIRGFRSRDHESLGLYCAHLPAGRGMRVGASKDRLCKGGSYSCLTRDEAYARMNDRWWSAFPVDLDTTFDGLEDLRRRVLSTGCPWLPTLVVYHPGPKGEVVRPHLYFQLPAGSAVWNAPDDPRCSVKARSLFRAVHRAIVDLLMPVGADPGGLSNPHHAKNPLSPRWSVATLDEPVYPTMTQWAQARRCDGSRILRLGVSQEQMLRTKAAAEASRVGKDATWSNSLFSETRRACFAQIGAWKAAKDPRYSIGVVGRKRLCQSLLDALGPRCDESSDPAYAAYVLDRVAPWVARAWDGQRDLVPVARGRDAHLLDAGMVLEERQSMAGAVTSRARRDASLEAVLRVLRGMGAAASKAAVAKASGLGLSTVKRRWTDATTALRAGAEAGVGPLAATGGRRDAGLFIYTAFDPVSGGGAGGAESAAGGGMDGASETPHPAPTPCQTPAPASSPSTSHRRPPPVGARSTAASPPTFDSSAAGATRRDSRGGFASSSATSRCSSTPRSSSWSATPAGGSATPPTRGSAPRSSPSSDVSGSPSGTPVRPPPITVSAADFSDPDRWFALWMRPGFPVPCDATR